MRISTFISALLVSTAIVSAASAADYNYDAQGRLVEQVNNDGSKTVYTYNQETGAKEKETTYRADNSVSSVKEYDQSGKNVVKATNYRADENNTVSSVREYHPGTSTTKTYTEYRADGTMSSQQQNNNKGTTVSNLSYAADGTTISSGSKTTYNTDGTVDKRETYSNGSSYVSEQYQYDNGKVTSYTAYNSNGSTNASSSYTIDYDYYTDGTLKSQTQTNGKNVVTNLSTYAENGTLLEQTRYSTSGNGKPVEQKIYNEDGQILSSLKAYWSDGTGTTTHEYTYGDGTRTEVSKYYVVDGRYYRTETQETVYGEDGQAVSSITYSGTNTNNPSNIKSGWSIDEDGARRYYNEGGTSYVTESGTYDMPNGQTATSKITTTGLDGKETVTYQGYSMLQGQPLDDMAIDMEGFRVTWDADGKIVGLAGHTLYGEDMTPVYENGKLVSASSSNATGTEYYNQDAGYEQMWGEHYNQWTGEYEWGEYYEYTGTGAYNEWGSYVGEPYSVTTYDERTMTPQYNEAGQIVGYQVMYAETRETNYEQWGETFKDSSNYQGSGLVYTLDENGNIIELRGTYLHPDGWQLGSSATNFENGELVGYTGYYPDGSVKYKEIKNENDSFDYYAYDENGNLLYTKIQGGKDEYGNDVTLCYDASGAFDASCSQYYTYDDYGNKIGYYSNGTLANTYNWASPSWQQDILDAEAAAEAERIAAEQAAEAARLAEEQAAQAAEEARIAAARAEAEARERERMLRMKRIYTIEEASALSKDTGNTIRLRYR